MRTTLWLFVITYCACGLAPAAPKLKDPPTTGRMNLVGCWVPHDGGRLQEFTDGGVLLVGEEPSREPPRYVINTKTNPAEFDLTHPGNDVTWRGICKVEGDTLSICIS